MTFTEAAAEVLRIAGKPLHYKEITDLAIEKNLLSHVGKSPEVTMGARLAALLKKEDKSNPIVRVKPGVFALRDWEGSGGAGALDHEAGSTLRDSMADDASDDASRDDDEGTEVNALEVEAASDRDRRTAAAATRPRYSDRESRSVVASGSRGVDGDHADDDDDDEPLIMSGDDALRADLVARAADVFDDEDDDDQPIFAGGDSEPPPVGAHASTLSAGAELGVDGGRRRRRRRRRRGGRELGLDDRAASQRDVNGTSGSIPVEARLGINGEADAVTVTDGARDVLAPAPRPMVRERHQIMGNSGSQASLSVDLPANEGDELAGRDLADAAAILLQASDRTQGPVPARTLVDTLIRRGRLGSDHRDPTATSVQLTAALRADNMRRASAGQRPRFRFAHGNQGARLALTDWSLSPELTRLEAEAIAAVERYREVARRSLLRKIQDLPGHALVELVLLCLERLGMSQIRAIRRPGASGGEVHFSAVHRTSIDEVRTAVVIRKDGREVGRERVTDLRGALHHYNNATSGWIVTTGQVLSGAREEACAPSAPIALFDGFAVCKLLEEGSVGVVKTTLSTFLPDLELFETLRA